MFRWVGIAALAALLAAACGPTPRTTHTTEHPVCVAVVSAGPTQQSAEQYIRKTTDWQVLTRESPSACSPNLYVGIAYVSENSATLEGHIAGIAYYEPSDERGYYHNIQTAATYRVSIEAAIDGAVDRFRINHRAKDIGPSKADRRFATDGKNCIRLLVDSDTWKTVNARLESHADWKIITASFDKPPCQMDTIVSINVMPVRVRGQTVGYAASGNVFRSGPPYTTGITVTTASSRARALNDAIDAVIGNVKSL